MYYLFYFSHDYLQFLILMIESFLYFNTGVTTRADEDIDTYIALPQLLVPRYINFF
jgi:hypothetical protein